MLGSAIAVYFGHAGYDVVVLTRRPGPAKDGVRYVGWDGQSAGDWSSELNGAELVVNLAGASINCRFNKRNKERIMHSRIAATKVISEAVASVSAPPKCWVNASGIAIYGESAIVLDESDTPRGEDFLALVGQEWEQAFWAADTPGTRKVCVRISPVLFAGSGMLVPLMRLVRFGLGGPVGRGDQYVSWIHETDFVRLVDWIFRQKYVDGVINACSPNPVQNKELMRCLRKTMNMPFGLPNYEWATRLGARVIGSEPDLVLSGQRIVSGRLGNAGFAFQYPYIEDAIGNLISQGDKNNQIDEL